MLQAEEAQAVGLVNEVHRPDDLERRAADLARELADLPSLAVAEIKRCVLEGLDTNLAAGLALEERGNLFLLPPTMPRKGCGPSSNDGRPSSVPSHEPDLQTPHRLSFSSTETAHGRQHPPQCRRPCRRRHSQSAGPAQHFRDKTVEAGSVTERSDCFERPNSPGSRTLPATPARYGGIVLPCWA
jgi:hypothetical protein